MKNAGVSLRIIIFRNETGGNNHEGQCRAKLLRHNGLKGHEDDFKVFDERMVGNVLEVNAELVLHNYVAVVLLGIGGLLQKLILVAVADGGHVGDTGADIQDAQLFRGVEVDVLPDLGSGTHQAHVPDENVDELREFIQLILNVSSR